MPRPLPPRLRLSLLLLAALWLSACSQVELVYDNADWLAYRWASRLVDASSAQREAWRPAFDELLEVHRATLLPRVVDLLGDLERAAGGGLTERRLACLVDLTDELYRAHARLAVPLALRVLGDVTPAQVGHLAEALQERNREYAEKYLPADPGARAQARVERYLERIERWTGALNGAQRARALAAFAQMPDTAAPWLEYRRQQQRRLVALLREPRDMHAVEAFLVDWWVELDGRDAELVQRVDAVRGQWIRLAVDLAAMLSAEQRATFFAEVGGLRADLAAAAGLDLPPGVIAGPLRCA